MAVGPRKRQFNSITIYLALHSEAGKRVGGSDPNTLLGHMYAKKKKVFVVYLELKFK